jgi:hypothetical protein
MRILHRVALTPTVVEVSNFNVPPWRGTRGDSGMTTFIIVKFSKCPNLALIGTGPVLPVEYARLRSYKVSLSIKNF